MSIRADFESYFDRCGLLAPEPNPGLIGSDNGPMFLSEYYIMLKKHGELTDQDQVSYWVKIANCMNEDGTLNRVTKPYKASQTGPDDYLGVLNGCKQLGIKDLPRQMLKSILRNFGFLNNVETGGHSKESFLIRQPQIVAAIVAASYPEWKLSHFFARLLALPFFAWAALVIAISCIGAPESDTDARRLSWHLLQSTRDVSLLCWLASLIWYRRLYRHFGNDGMRAVAAIYYQPRCENPYAKHWVNE
jgi:hypothetical protein